MHVVSGEGKLLATISPSNKSDDQFGASFYCDNFRDEKLKINDDRKVKLTLSDFQQDNVMILLTVKTNDLKGAKTEGMDYAKAWFRIQNEDTNQTLDYNNIDKVKADEEFEEAEDPEDGGDDDVGDDDEEPK